MKISFITTVFNEEKTIERFLESVFAQTRMPDEVVVVDGGSGDGTVSCIKNCRFIKTSRGKHKTEFKVLVKKGNRAVGRNEAIRNASGDIIVCSDAGNILDKDWVKEIVAPFSDAKVDVVAGYYKARVENVFQKCLVPYVFVMPDKVDPDNFLPATRSVALRKSVWKRVEGFDERFSHNEDYVFAKTLQKIGAKIVFKKDAIVYWLPRTNLGQTFYMFFRFAYGDTEAGIWRPKVLFLLFRYIIGIALLIYCLAYKEYFILTILFIILVFYILWAITKNYKYVKQWQAIFILPILQFTADFAVLSGSIGGVLKVWDIQKTS